MSPDSPIVRRLQDECALDSTYAKACDIAGSGGVLTCAVERSAIDGVVRLSGAVRASSGPPYHASATLDLGEGDVVGYGCTCPASYSYDGMCKHSAALVLCYLDGTVAGGQESEPPGNRQNEKGPHATRDLRAPQRPSSPQLSRLFSAIAAERVDAAAARRALRTAREDLGDPADFEVTLLPASTYAYGTQTWLLKLKVRRGRASYIVRNMGELVRAWERHAELSYGKNLSFVHTPGAFTERARAIARTGGAHRAQPAGPVLLALQILGRRARDRRQGASPLRCRRRRAARPAAGLVVHLRSGHAATSTCPGARSRSSPATPRSAPPSRSIRAAASTCACLPRSPALQRETSSTCSTTTGHGAVPRGFPDARARCSASCCPHARRYMSPRTTSAPSAARSFPSWTNAVSLRCPTPCARCRPPEPRFTFEVGLEDGEVSCRATVTYGERSPGALRTAAPRPALARPRGRISGAGRRRGLLPRRGASPPASTRATTSCSTCS